MPDFLGRGHDQPVPVNDDDKNERLAAEKALAWLRAILRQTNAKMITVESLERGLRFAPEAEVADLLQQKVSDLLLEVYHSSGNTGQVRGSEDAVQLYLVFLAASSAMTPHEFSAVERLHHELKQHFSQVAMLKPSNKVDEAIIDYLWWLKNKFESAKDFSEVRESVMDKASGKEDQSESGEVIELKESQKLLLDALGKYADKLEVGEKAELTAEQEKLLSLLKRHEDKIEGNNREVVNKEAEVQKLHGRLYLQMAQADAVGLGKTISALNKMGRGDLVMTEIIRRRKQVTQYDGWKYNKQVAVLRLLTTELTFEQMDEVDKWDEALRVAEEEAQRPKLPTSDERAAENKELEARMWEMVDKFRDSLHGFRGEDPGFARSWLHSLHESWVLNAKAEALHVLTNEINFELNEVRELSIDGTNEEIGNWLVQRQHLLEVFKMIEDIATVDEKKAMDKYRIESQASLELLEARIRPVKKQVLVKAEVQSTSLGKEVAAEMTEEQKEETLMGQLRLGSFGHVRTLLEKWGWTKEKITADEALKFAAQKGIEKLWLEKPLARAIWVKFIEEFELQTPVEPKMVKKSKKNI